MTIGTDERLLELAASLDWLTSNHDEDFPVNVVDSDEPGNDRVISIGDIRNAANALRARTASSTREAE